MPILKLYNGKDDRLQSRQFISGLTHYRFAWCSCRMVCQKSKLGTIDRLYSKYGFSYSFQISSVPFYWQKVHSDLQFLCDEIYPIKSVAAHQFYAVTVCYYFIASNLLKWCGMPLELRRRSLLYGQKLWLWRKSLRNPVKRHQIINISVNSWKRYNFFPRHSGCLVTRITGSDLDINRSRVLLETNVLNFMYKLLNG